jgi:hypothetical protein
MQGTTLLVSAAVIVATAIVSSRAALIEAPMTTRHNSRQQPPAPPARLDGRLISATGVGALRVGMTLAEARRTHPTSTFARTSDGDGAALVEVSLAPRESLILSTDEEDPELPIDWSKRIKRIETFSAAFYTAEGVRVGSLVTEVERVFGPTRQIVKSEIESREYIEFERQPAYLTLRLNYTGIFSAGERTTTRFQRGATLHSITVSAPHDLMAVHQGRDGVPCG